MIALQLSVLEFYTIFNFTFTQLWLIIEHYRFTQIMKPIRILRKKLSLSFTEDELYQPEF